MRYIGAVWRKTTARRPAIDAVCKLIEKHAQLNCWHDFAHRLPWSVLVPRVCSLQLAASLMTAPLRPSFVPSVCRGGKGAARSCKNAWVRKAPGVDTAAVYFVLQNTSPKPIIVIGVRHRLSPSTSMIHETSMVEGQSRMRMRDKIVIAPGKSVAFAPGGLHVMLSGFRYVRGGGRHRAAHLLHCEGGGTLKVAAVVRPLDAK